MMNLEEAKETREKEMDENVCACVCVCRHSTGAKAYGCTVACDRWSRRSLTVCV